MIVLDLFLDNPLAIGFTIGLTSIVGLMMERLAVRFYKQKYAEIVSYERLSTSRCCQINMDTLITPFELISRLLLALTASIFFYLLFNNHLPISSLPNVPITLLVELAIGGIILSQITNIIIDTEILIVYFYVRSNPSSLTGSLTIKEELSFASSIVKHILIGSIWFAVFVLVNEIFFLGGAIYEIHRLSKLRQLQ